MKKIRNISVTFLTASALLLFSAPVLAEGGTSSGSGSTSGSGTTSHTGDATETRHTTETESQTMQTEQARAAEKVSEAHATACTHRKNSVTTIEKRVANRGQARFDAITKIADKVENYVTTSKLVVTNYDSLVSDVNAKKAAAQAAINTTKTDPGEVNSVTCKNGDGKAKVESFKKDMKAQQSALKAYKQAVKNLVKAVKEAKTEDGGNQ